MKQFGLGSRIMETRIRVEVAEMMKQVRLFAGRQFNPKDVFTRCILNVIASIVFGRRYEFDDPSLTEIRDIVGKRVMSHVPELEVSSLLRFVPRFRRRIEAMSFAAAELHKLVERTVTILLLVTASYLTVTLRD